MFDLLLLDRHFFDNLVRLANLERDHFGQVQFLQVGHEHRADELLHALQPHYLHVHDALDLVQDVLRDVRSDADHPLQRAT